MLCNLFRLALRSTEGLVKSLIELLGLPIIAPTYSILSRRQESFSIPTYKNKNGQPMHLVVDATGIKIYSEGEWKMRQHGKEKRRTWRKLHIAVNEATQDIVIAVVTAANVNHSEMLVSLLTGNELSIKQVSGDGAYDTYNCYQSVIAYFSHNERLFRSASEC
jgi:hypothetical protein